MNFIGRVLITSIAGMSLCSCGLQSQFSLNPVVVESPSPGDSMPSSSNVAKAVSVVNAGQSRRTSSGYQTMISVGSKNTATQRETLSGYSVKFNISGQVQ